MYARIINENADENNLIETDLEIFYPSRLVDSEGIQYSLSVLQKFTPDIIFNLFGIREIKHHHNYSEDAWDEEIQERVFTHYNVSTDNNYIIKNFSLQNKPQEIIDSVMHRREFESSISYRVDRRNAYASELSPEGDLLCSIGDVLDALYQAIYHGEIDKLGEISTKIEDIKTRYPKPPG